MIYKLNYKEIKKKLSDFGKTTYGKTIFVACYSPFFLTFICVIFGCINFYKEVNIENGYTLLAFIFLSSFSICLGTYGFYKELKKFIENSK